MREKCLYVLLDFSIHSRFQLVLANQWCRWFNMKLIMVHQMDKLTPTLASPDLRLKIEYDIKRDIQNNLDVLRRECIDEDVAVSFEIPSEPLTGFLQRKLKAENLDILVIGLKGTGKFKQIFIGSTAAKIIEELNQITLALPNTPQDVRPEKLVVGVHYKFPVNENALNKLIDLISDKLIDIQFISVITVNDQKEETIGYLNHLREKYLRRCQCSVKTFEGSNPFEEIKSYLTGTGNGFLVVQKGSRSFTDRMFRKFMINELVYDGSIPLIVLPL